MAATYTDIIETMIEADKMDSDIDTVVLTSESMNSFLADDKFAKATEKRMEETIGGEWELAVESGDGNYLRLESGEQIPLE